MDITYTFRPTRQSWMRQVLLPVVFLFGLISLLMALIFTRFVNGLFVELAIGLSCFALISLFYIMSYAVRLLRHTIYIDKVGLRGQFHREESIEIKWSDVIAIWVDEDLYNNTHLYFGTLTETKVIGLQTLDVDALWLAVKSLVNPEALHSNARERLPTYVAWINRTKELEELVKVRSLQATDNEGSSKIGRITAVFCAALFIWSMINAEWWPSLIFLTFMALGLSLMFSVGVIQMDGDAITYTRRFSQRRIGWDEIEKIEMPADRGQLVLIGHDKQLAISGGNAWRGSDNENMGHWVQIQIEKRQIEVVASWKASYKWSQNTRV